LPKDGGIINDINDLNNEKWVSVMNINSKKPYWRGVFKNGDKTYISVNRVLVSFKNLKQLGVMSIMIPELRLKYLLSQNNEKNNASIYLIDNENKVVAQKTDNEMLSKTKEINELSHANFEDEEGIKYSNIGGQKYILAYTTSNITGWKFMALYPYKAITKRVEAIKYAVAILLLIGIIISTIITIFMAYATTRRLNKMRKKMNTLKNNRLAKLEVIYGNDEIGNLDRTFNDMINRINELIEHEDDFQLQKARLQVELLQSQINPHILYNTLATIQWRAKKEGVEDVGIVVERLIRFFKHFLNNGEIISRIEHEMDMITQYIDILKFTYSMSFDCVISLKDDVNKYLSLNMFLQPIVENAIIHGLRPSEKPSKLEIYGSIKDEKILFIVKDNGIGIDSEMVDKINKGEILKNKGGYGISNVVKRIQLYFGEEYGLKITSEAEIGTEVTLTLPANITEEQEQLFKPVI